MLRPLRRVCTWARRQSLRHSAVLQWRFWRNPVRSPSRDTGLRWMCCLLNAGYHASRWDIDDRPAGDGWEGRPTCLYIGYIGLFSLCRSGISVSQEAMTVAVFCVQMAVAKTGRFGPGLTQETVAGRGSPVLRYACGGPSGLALQPPWACAVNGQIFARSQVVTTIPESRIADALAETASTRSRP